MKADYKYFTAPCGLNVVHIHTVGDVEYCGVDIAVGSRNETSDEYGMAHFIEHTIFKGTESRPASYISNRMEQVGGELNAYTSKDETVIYTTFPKGNVRRAVSLIADLVINSNFPDEQLNLERAVVLDEIDSYRDSPAEAIYDDFEEFLFAGTPMAHNILGNRTAIETFDSMACRAFRSRYYVARNMVFFYMGPTPAKTVFDFVTRYFDGLLPELEDVRPVSMRAFKPTRFEKEMVIDSHQAHTIIGTTLPGIDSELRFSIALLTNILGGPGMNARLNTVLRERHGLVYTIEATASFFRDCGELTIYFGCDAEDVERCKHLVFRELDKIAEKPLSAIQLERARRQYLGQLIVAGDNREQFVLSVAHEYLYNYLKNPENPHPIVSHIDEIKAITPESLHQAACLLKDASVLTFT